MDNNHSHTASITTYSTVAKSEKIGDIVVSFIDDIDSIITGYGFKKVSHESGQRVFELGDKDYYLVYMDKDQTLTIASERCVIVTKYIISKEEQLRYLISSNLHLKPYLK